MKRLRQMTKGSERMLVYACLLLVVQAMIDVVGGRGALFFIHPLIISILINNLINHNNQFNVVKYGSGRVGAFELFNLPMCVCPS
jgi:hypothetical protein